MNDVRHVPERSRFLYEQDGSRALLSYDVDDEGGTPTVTFLHTVVPEALAGHGVGGLLAETGVRWAREQGLRVVPACPFVRAWLGKHPEALAG